MILLKDILEGKHDLNHKKMWFIRYGGLSSKKQLGYNPNDKDVTYHAPPARHGFYAFVWPYIEYFLLGGDTYVNPKKQKKGQTLRIQYLKDKDGNRITQDHPEFEKFSNSNKNWSMIDRDQDQDKVNSTLYRNSNRKKFTYDGDLWHHLGDYLDNSEILARRGSWVKSSIDAFRKALIKDRLKDKLSRMRDGIGYTKDHLEVFIEKI